MAVTKPEMAEAVRYFFNTWSICNHKKMVAEPNLLKPRERSSLLRSSWRWARCSPNQLVVNEIKWVKLRQLQPLEMASPRKHQVDKRHTANYHVEMARSTWISPG